MDNQHKPITEETAKRLVGILTKSPAEQVAKSFELAKKPIYHIRNSQIIAGITGSVGLIVFALGVENLITNVLGVSSPFVEITFGLILLSISGLFLKKIL